MVRVPISENGCMVFIKEEENAPLSAYIYRWKSEKSNKKGFTGKASWFSFQDYQMRGQKFIADKGSDIILFKGKEDIQKIVQQKKSGVATTSSWLGDALRAIGNFVGALSCWATAGSWENSYSWSDNQYSYGESCNGQFWTWTWSFGSGSSGGSESGSESGTESGSESGSESGGGLSNYSGMLFLNITSSYTSGGSYGGGGTGSTGGGGSESGTESGGTNYWTDFYVSNGYVSPAVILAKELGLTANESAWLNNNLTRTSEVQSYLDKSPLPAADKRAIAIAHIRKMIADPAYLTFVQNYVTYVTSTASIVNNYHNSVIAMMWWENVDWLDGNFYLNADLGFNQLSQEEKLFIKSDPIKAYEISRITTLFKIGIHKKITQYAAENAGLSTNFINNAVLGVEDTDIWTVFGMVPGTAPLHFDGLTSYTAVINNYNLIVSKINATVQKSHVNHTDLYTLGALLHALQDFYSHSN